MKKAILYEIVNRKNNLRYIGVTTTKLRERWAVHLYRLRKGKATFKIQEAFNKLGESEFYINQLNTGCLSEMLLIEKELTRDTVINGYNVIIGGGDSEERSSSSKVFREKLKLNPEYANVVYKKIGDSQRGKTMSDEAKSKMRAAKIGKKWKDEHRNNRGKQFSGAGNPNYGNYKLYLNTQTGIFYTTPELQLHLGVKYGLGKVKREELFNFINV